MIKSENRKKLGGVGERAELDQIVGIHRIGAVAAEADPVSAVMLFSEEHRVAADATVFTSAVGIKRITTENSQAKSFLKTLPLSLTSE